MKKILFIVILFLLSCYIDVYAVDHLPVTYTSSRYSNTTVWYSIIPSKYKMHYSYGGDVVGRDEAPSANAARHNATVAINTQHMGAAKIEGTQNLLQKGDNVSAYDFYVIENVSDSYSNYAAGAGTNVPHLIATNPKSSKVGIDLSTIKNPIWCTDVMCYVPLVVNGSIVNNWYNNWQGIVNGTTSFTGRYISGTTVEENHNYHDVLTEKHPRSWLAIDNEGNQFVATCGGRSSTEAGFDAKDIYNATTSLFTSNIKYLYMLDGGGSTSFVYKGEKKNPNIDSSERVVNGIFYWKVDNYDISYNLDGGTVNGTNPTTYNVDTSSFTLKNPTKEGYEFVGWNEEIDGVGTAIRVKNMTVTIDKNHVGNRKYSAVFEQSSEKGPDDIGPPIADDTNNNDNSNDSTEPRKESTIETVINNIPDTLARISRSATFYGIVFITMGLYIMIKKS